jgi:hypothetical protein
MLRSPNCGRRLIKHQRDARQVDMDEVRLDEGTFGA